jgi:hypothetical protein
MRIIKGEAIDFANKAKSSIALSFLILISDLYLASQITRAAQMARYRRVTGAKNAVALDKSEGIFSCFLESLPLRSL